MKKVIRFLFKGYRRYISPLIGSNCRFYPSCSLYSEEAIVKKGLILGGVLMLKRLFRCHPFCAGGYDPVG